MSGDDDPHCPECGEPISATASYCMHCYADLPSGPVGASGSAADQGGTTNATTSADVDAVDEGGTTHATTSADVDAADDYDPAASTGTPTREDDGDGVLDPEGAVDNVLTILVAIAGSIVIGFVGLIALLLVTGSAWALPVAFFAWLGGLAYLARQYSVQETIAKTFYGAAAVLLLLPLVAVSPAVEGGVGDRVVIFLSTLVGVLVPAGVSLLIGYAVMQFAPEGS